VRRSYNIYCLSTFIGFCIIHDDGVDIRASLFIFEMNTDEYKAKRNSVNKKKYPLNTINIDIMKDLMSVAIPSKNTNGLIYTAKRDGEIYVL
jgi:hypothetical protein